ncbi:hypothetical protein A2V49_00650 [candidate division WWE3 bacterium RBG_19FT_COMBO_34_6]|uniref:Uncharacterized protein n=1 Tax=candidate division WWE3 bacterium RBG_19FT_COMBO_34_6 TaxID=1802612 RepID=A0A1F4UP28_UNCKA|nr:MAG: hypothetical protein A2V49_00650 [candidate division WWE3 bacterium RBG_19FT_COMBO_34_6]
MKKIIVIVAVLLIIFIVGSMFVSRIVSRKLGEKTLERAMEKASGGKVDVDVNQDGDKVEMTWETEEGQVQVSSKGTLPKGFPSQIPLYKGYKIAGSMTTDNGASGTVSLSVSDDTEKVYSYYQDEFESNNWNISSTYSADEAKYISVEKDDFRVSIIVNKDTNSEDTMIVISYGPNETDQNLEE